MNFKEKIIRMIDKEVKSLERYSKEYLNDDISKDLVGSMNYTICTLISLKRKILKIKKQLGENRAT